MNHEELEQYIWQYTEEEIRAKSYMESQTPETGRQLQDERQTFRKLDSDTYLFESSRFMEAGKKIVVSRQDRFRTVCPHKHDYIELCYVWEGECRQSIEGKEVFDSAFLSRMTRMGIVSEFLADAVTRNRKKEHYLYFPSHRSERIRQIMEQILLEYFTADLGMEEILESYLIILFTELLRLLRDISIEKKSVSNDVQILELLAYIEEHYETCTLKEMGKAFGMHGNYLTAVLKEKTGRSFVEHVQEQRLRKARTLLENTDIPMTELIPMCGYNNINFFYKKFREAEGCTPAQFRKERKKNRYG